MLSAESGSGAPTDQSLGTADAARASAAKRIIARNAPRIFVGLAGAAAIGAAVAYRETAPWGVPVAAYGGLLIGWLLPQFEHVSEGGDEL